MNSRRLADWFIFLLLIIAPFSSSALEADEEAFFCRKLHQDGHHELAAAQIETFLEQHPQHEQALELSYLLGRSCLELERYRQAADLAMAFALARPEDPRSCPALYDAAIGLSHSGQTAPAKPLIDLLLRDYRDCDHHADAVFLAARHGEANGDRATALQLLAYLIEAAPGQDTAAKARIFRAGLREEGNPAAARADLEAVKAALPRHALAGMAALRLARLDLAAARSAAAIRELEWLLSNYEEKTLRLPALRLMARVAEDEGRFADAAEHVAELRAGDSRQQDKLLAREARLLIRAGRQAEAVGRVEHLLSVAGENPASLFLLAEALNGSGRGAEAREIWTRVAAMEDSGDEGRQALRRLFTACIETGDEVALAPVATRLIAGAPGSDARAELMLAWAAFHRREGREQPARNLLESIEGECPGSRWIPEALSALAIQHAQAGRWKQAQAIYERLLREFGASARGMEASAKLEELERYHHVDQTRAIDELIALLDDPEPERDARLGRILIDDLKDFTRAARLFSDLAAAAPDTAARAIALVRAGRACLLESEREALLGRERSALAWRERAERNLESALGLSPLRSRSRREAQRELTLLRLSDLEEGPEQIPLLADWLKRYPDAPGAEQLYLLRAGIYDRGRGGKADHPWTALALDDYRFALELGTETDVGRFRARLALARLLLETGDHQTAEGHLRILLSKAAGRFEGGEAIFTLGELFESRKQFRQALGWFERFLEVAPTSPRAPRCLIHLGDCHYFLRDWDRAVLHYQRLLDEFADDTLADDAAYRCAMAEEKAGRLDRSLDRLRWLETHGSERFRREAAWRLARSAIDSGRRKEAIAPLRRLLGLSWQGTHAVEGGLTLGELLLETGEGAAALELFDSLLVKSPLGEQKPQARSGRIRALLAIGRGEQALADWAVLQQDSLLAARDAGRVHLDFTRWFSARSDGVSARDHIDKGLALPKDDSFTAWLLYEKGLLLARERRYDSALAQFDKVIADYPGTEAALESSARSGGILFNQGRYDDAARHFDLALADLDSPPASLLYGSSLALEKVDRDGEALGRLRTFLARYPEDDRVAEAMLKVGYLLRKLGRFERALDAYANAELFQDREGKARLHFWTADCLEAMGRGSEAIAAFLKVSYLYADQGMWGVTATLRAAQIYETEGDAARARALYDKVLAAQGPGSQFGRVASEGLARLDGER